MVMGLGDRTSSSRRGRCSRPTAPGHPPAPAIAGWATYNEQQLQRLQDPLRWSQYVLGSDFWSRTLQNWQSEFLAVGSMAVLSIYLCQRGSPESKPVGAAHSSTGVEG
jgi:hypothetical protein